MLTVYRSVEEIPEGIKYVHDNDEFFDGSTNLSNTDICKSLLRDIDGAVYESETTFTGRNKINKCLEKGKLSTGLKTLLNIVENNGVCFNMEECGSNALNLLPKISLYVENGSILWDNTTHLFDEEYPCDIEYKGIKFTNACDFSQCLIDEEYKECEESM